MKSTWTTSPDLRQRGFSVPAAVFIVVILAALGAFLVTLGSSQQLGLAQDVLGTRALMAARSGIEWGVYQVVKGGTFRTNCRSSSATAKPSFDSDFLVSVSCTSLAYNEGTSTTPIYTYQLVAIACNNTGQCPLTSNLPSTYVERRIVTSVTTN